MKNQLVFDFIEAEPLVVIIPVLFICYRLLVLNVVLSFLERVEYNHVDKR